MSAKPEPFVTVALIENRGIVGPGTNHHPGPIARVSDFVLYAASTVRIRRRTHHSIIAEHVVAIPDGYRGRIIPNLPHQLLVNTQYVPERRAMHAPLYIMVFNSDREVITIEKGTPIGRVALEKIIDLPVKELPIDDFVAETK